MVDNHWHALEWLVHATTSEMEFRRIEALGVKLPAMSPTNLQKF